MKRLFLFSFLFLFVFSVFAQKDNTKKLFPINHKGLQKVIQKDLKILTKDSKEISIGEPIGITNYDLQSNSAVQKRILNYGDGTLSVVWLQDHSANPGGATRGTGYNYYDGSSWQYTDLSGVNGRIEGIRTGWPSLSTDGAGNEFVFNHYKSTGGVYGWTQTVGNSNTGWTEQDASVSEPITWPRVAQSGQNIVIIGAGEDDLGFNLHNPVVIRSVDGGVSFSDISSSIDFSSQIGVQGDSYAITSRGDIFAFIIFSSMNDVSIWKSEDAGLTWNETKIIDLPIVYNNEGGALYDQNSDGIADVVCATDGTGDIIIDSEGIVHVVFSRMNSLDDDPSAEGNSFFPYTDYVLYWNEGMGAGHYTDEAILNGFSEDNPFIIDSLNMSLSIDTIGWFPDLNSDGQMNLVDVATGEYPFGMYYGGLSSMSSIGIDDNDNIYVSYSTVMEGDDYVKNDAQPNAQQYRHLWVTKYNGEAWGTPVLVSGVDGNNAENVYGTMANLVDDNVHLWVQWDSEPGVKLKEDTDPVTDNYIVYKKIPVTELPDATDMTYDVDITVIDSSNKGVVNGADVTFAYGVKNCGDDNAVKFTNAYPGTYKIIVNADGYSQKEVVVTISGDHAEEVDLAGLISTNDITKNEVNIFPNPAEGYIKISNSGNSKVSIINILGDKVFSKVISENEQINLKSFSKGTYFVKISNDKGTITKKLVVK